MGLLLFLLVLSLGSCWIEYNRSLESFSERDNLVNGLLESEPISSTLPSEQLHAQKAPSTPISNIILS